MVIENAVAYIRELFAGDSGGHDFAHSMRVYRTAVRIAREEGADETVTALAALLHDADDRKLSPETCEHKDNAVAFLRGQGVAEETISRIVAAIDDVSFRGTDSVVPGSIEGKCVQDADRLDALGAIGVARTFAYGGSRGREMYDPEEKPALHMTGDEYKNHVSTSVNHFYEKLFTLKDRMSTAAGRRIAEKRESYMRDFLAEFLLEWDGKDL